MWGSPVSPRAGGEASKVGHRYEMDWTVRQLLRVLRGQLTSVTVEDVGQLQVGSEFTAEKLDGALELHQVKRSAGTGATWTTKKLHDEGVFEAALLHGSHGRTLRFTSTTPAPVVGELAVAARRDSGDLARFRVAINQKQTGEFTQIAESLGAPEAALLALATLHFDTVGETDLAEVNAMLASAFYDVPPHVSTFGDVLVGIVQDRLGHRLTRELLDRELEQQGIRRLDVIGSATLDAARACTVRWEDSVRRELLESTIERSETELVLQALTEHDGDVVVTGAAGSGKSAVLLEVAQRLQNQDWPVLALRMDWLTAVTHAQGIGEELGLGRSPVASLAGLAGGDAPSVLIIDQVDALSGLAGRSRTGLDVLGELLVHASEFPQMRVLLSCRTFDAQHDVGLRRLVQGPGAAHVEIPPLTAGEVARALEAMHAPAAATAAQSQLLNSPLNLVLLAGIGSGPSLTWTSRTQVLDAFWDHKRAQHVARGGTDAGFAQALYTVTKAMSERAELTVPIEIADAAGLAGEVDLLVSGDVLRRHGRRLQFFHETFFDYTFARWWSTRDQSLRAFLVQGEQELFRRAQVRQVLVHLRESDTGRWLREVEDLLTAPDIRFHLKAVVLAVLRSQAAPSTAELAMLQRVRAAPSTSHFTEHLDSVLRSPGWFDRLREDGHLQQWLVSDDPALQRRATDVLRSSVNDRPDEVAQLLTDAEEEIDTGPLLGEVLRIVEINSSRPLFDLVLQALNAGALRHPREDFWLPLHNLGKSHPAWAAEAVAHYLVHRQDAWTLTEDGRVDGWRYSNHWADELISGAANGAPAQYCEQVLPHLLYAAHLTARDDGIGQLHDGHFSYRIAGAEAGYLDDALANAAVLALRQLTVTDPAQARPWLHRLAVSELDVAQWLLYEAMSAAGAAGDREISQWAAQVLLEGPHRFLSGSGSDSFFHAGQALAGISPHIDDDSFHRLEHAVLEFAAPWDRQRDGRSQFRLLWSLDQTRLSERARRRLDELRRKFRQDRPPEPEGVIGGFIDSPVPATAAEHMTDEHWLAAFAQYPEEHTNWTSFTGGAHELAQLLQSQVKKQPDRFARLALRMDGDTHPAYTCAVLLGLGDPERPVESLLVFDAIRHISALQREADKRWLGWPLRRHYDEHIPTDILDLLLHTALHAASPTAEELHWDEQDSDSRRAGSALMSAAINSARGAAAEILGDLLIHDGDGSRTAHIAPEATQLAADPAVPVRAAVAHLLAACLRHAPQTTEDAFPVLIDTDDRLLATRTAEDLIAYLSRRSVDHVEAVLRRMAASDHADVRQAGGRLLTFIGLERDRPDLLDVVRQSDDAHLRRGGAAIVARRLPITSQRDEAKRLLLAFFHDSDPDVVDAAADVAAALRGKPLHEFDDVLRALIDSPALSKALPQLFITLEQAPDALNDLTLDVVAAVLATHRQAVGDPSTSISADAHHGFELVARVLQQAHDVDTRRKALDLVDELLLLRVYTPLRWFDEHDR